jgi:hypothetical protein
VGCAAFPSDYHRRLDVVASRGQWTAQIETWGGEDGNRIDVALEDGRVQSVIVRAMCDGWTPGSAALIDFVRKSRGSPCSAYWSHR